MSTTAAAITAEHARAAQCQNDLLPHVVDRLARARPDAVYAEWVSGSASGTVAITYAQLANAVDGLAWWLVERLGGPGRRRRRRRGLDAEPEPEPAGLDDDVLAYVGPNDLRYGALVLAAVKAGYVLFVTSPRNSPAAHQALFEHLQCRTLITSDPVPPSARTVLDAVAPQLHHLMAPSVEELLSKKYEPYVLDGAFKELRQEPFVVMHTSGTTGLPKPIVWTHETCAQVLNSKSRETPDGVPSVEGSLLNGKRVIVTLPPFHGALLAHLTLGAIPYGNVVIAPVAAAIPTAQGVVDALKQRPADVAVLVPSVVAELAHNRELLDYCAAHLEAILYIGGDLPQDIGDRVSAKIYLRCQWGATETGIVPQLLPPEVSSDRSLWRYVRIHPAVGAIFDEVADGAYELVVVRHDKNNMADMQPCFTVPGLEQLETYRTKDLFEPHPRIPDLWRWRARADDIIVFLNGEKTNPVSMEQHIMARDPELVSGALVIGAQRAQAALLIEPASSRPGPLTTAEQAALIERVWPSVEESNRSAPAHARVEKAFILVTSPDRPLVRAGKGTFMRGPSISQYAEEIEQLYASADVVPDEDSSSSRGVALHAMGLDGITRLVRQHVREVTGWSGRLDDAAENFFDRGMDSLQGLRLTRALRRSFHRPDLALSTVYQNPTVAQLAAAILGRKDDGKEDEERQVMESLFETYRGLIRQIPVPKHDPSSDERPSGRASSSGPVNVLLTGSTGTVGTYLLRALLDREGVGRIFCLNRGADGGRAAQQKSFTASGFATTEFDDGDDENNKNSNSRVAFIKADLHQPSLGLDSATYESLRAQVGLVIHAAWPVNFNLPLSAFRPQLAGLVNLLALAASTTIKAKFVFISSVAAVENHHQAAPERVLTDLKAAAPLGYARSKLLAEQLVAAAADHFSQPHDGAVTAGAAAAVETIIIRLGQIAGSVRAGVWNPREWLPSLVLSSVLRLRQVPDSLGRMFDGVDFVPVDLAGGVVIDLCLTRGGEEKVEGGGVTVFNVRNPHVTPWRALLPAIVDVDLDVNVGRSAVAVPPLQIVAPTTWLDALRASSDEDDDEGEDEAMRRRNPAVKLLDFYVGLWAADADADADGKEAQPMAIEHALAASPALRGMEAVGVEWMRKWVREWVALFA